MRRCFVIFLVTFCLACDKPELERSLPDCIRTLIEEQQDDITEVQQWSIEGSKYYYFVSDCCDRFNGLLGSDCEWICAPDGGLSGRGDEMCPDFPAEFNRTIVWQREA